MGITLQIKMVNKRKLAKMWEDSYGENFKTEYSGLWKILPKNFTREKLAELWDRFYGENFKTEYSGVWRQLK